MVRLRTLIKAAKRKRIVSVLFDGFKILVEFGDVPLGVVRRIHGGDFLRSAEPNGFGNEGVGVIEAVGKDLLEGKVCGKADHFQHPDALGVIEGLEFENFFVVDVDDNLIAVHSEQLGHNAGGLGIGNVQRNHDGSQGILCGGMVLDLGIVPLRERQNAVGIRHRPLEGQGFAQGLHIEQSSARSEDRIFRFFLIAP